MKLGGRIRRTKAPLTRGVKEAFVFLVIHPAVLVSILSNNRSVSSRLHS